MSYPKALSKIQMSAPNIEASAECFVCRDWVQMEMDLDLTKVQAYRIARKQGWTYDKAGDWTCPDCNRPMCCNDCLIGIQMFQMGWNGYEEGGKPPQLGDECPDCEGTFVLWDEADTGKEGP